MLPVGAVKGTQTANLIVPDMPEANPALVAGSRDQNRFTLIARTMRGLEDLLAREIKAIGGEKIQVQAMAVIFEGDTELMYKANLWSRLALRIVKPILTFHVKTQDDLYRNAMEYDWSQMLSIDQTFAIDHAVHSRLFPNSQFVALRTKDAIADSFRKRTGKRPSVDLRSPDIRLHVHILRQLCTISLDSSGSSLHRRGYRVQAQKAPLSEVLAAGMIQLSGWDRASALVNPMCGAGTIAIEAAQLAYNIAPGLTRDRFGFENWPGFDEALWQSLKKEALHKRNTKGPSIVALDLSTNAIRYTRENAEVAGLRAGDLTLVREAFENYEPPAEHGTVVMNPPYGERLQKQDIEGFYNHIGDRLKKGYAGYVAWILSSNQEALKRIGLKAEKKIPLKNGPLECSYRSFRLFSGRLEDQTDL